MSAENRGGGRPPRGARRFDSITLTGHITSGGPRTDCVRPPDLRWRPRAAGPLDRLDRLRAGILLRWRPRAAGPLPAIPPQAGPGFHRPCRSPRKVPLCMSNATRPPGSISDSIPHAGSSTGSTGRRPPYPRSPPRTPHRSRWSGAAPPAARPSGAGEGASPRRRPPRSPRCRPSAIRVRIASTGRNATSFFSIRSLL